MSPAQLAAADLIERVALRASGTPYDATMSEWIDPARTSDKRSVAILQSVLSDAIQNVPFHGTFPELPYYKAALETLAPVVAESSLYAAYSILRAQAKQLHALRTSIDTSAGELHIAAGDAWRLAREPLPRLDEMWLKGPAPMTPAERDAILHPSRYGTTVSPRVQRMKYMRAVRRGGSSQLLRLMAHPRGVESVDTFNMSAEEGRKYADEMIEGCLTAMGGLQMKLIEPDVIWHFPPAIAVGLRDLGLGERPALTKFFLAWAKRRGTLDSALETAGNATLVLTLAGPVGVAIQEVVGFVLAAIDTAVSFLNDLEQDQAATATAFADDAQRLSEGSSGLATAVKGATAILAALALPGAVRQLVGRAELGARVALAAREAPRAAPPTPRGLPLRRVDREPITTAERGVISDMQAAEPHPQQVRTATAPALPRAREVDAEAIELMLKDSKNLARMQKARPLADLGEPAAHRMIEERAVEVVTAKKFEYRGVAAFAAMGRRDRAIRFIDLDFMIDMTTIKATGTLNSAGFPRNSKAFWREMCHEYPRLFSPTNKRRILQDARAPRVDEQWLTYHPTQRPYLHDVLVHHHIEQGPWAAGIPQQVHRDFYPELHPFTNPDVLD